MAIASCSDGDATTSTTTAGGPALAPTTTAALVRDDGDPAWSEEFGGYVFSLAMNRGLVFVYSESHLVAYEREGGSILWERELPTSGDYQDCVAASESAVGVWDPDGRVRMVFDARSGRSASTGAVEPASCQHPPDRDETLVVQAGSVLLDGRVVIDGVSDYPITARYADLVLVSDVETGLQITNEDGTVLGSVEPDGEWLSDPRPFVFDEAGIATTTLASEVVYWTRVDLDELLATST
jgi:hypothetical protein